VLCGNNQYNIRVIQHFAGIYGVYVKLIPCSLIYSRELLVTINQRCFQTVSETQLVFSISVCHNSVIFVTWNVKRFAIRADLYFSVILRTNSNHLA